MLIQTQDHQKTGFSRRMSGAERRFLRLPNINVVMGARIQGAIDPSLLPDVIKKVKQKHPLLGVRIHLDEATTGWFTQEGVPKILIADRLRRTPDDWIEVAAKEQRRAFEIETGPLVRVILLQSPEVSDLIITAHHSICDGRSLVYLIRDILTYLAYPEREPEPRPVIPFAAERALPSSVSAGWLPRFVIKKINRKWLKKGIFFSEPDRQALHQEFWQKHRASRRRWELSAPQTSALITRCRQEVVTVNSALYAAFLKAQQSVQGKAGSALQTILVPVDFRNRLSQPVSESVGFYASAIMFKLKIRPKKAFWDIARTLDKKISQQLTDKNIFDSQKISLLSPSFMDGMVFAKYGKCDDKMVVTQVKRKGLDKLISGMMVSNLGRIDIPTDYGALRLEALLGPVAYSDGIEKVLEVVTVGGKMQFTLISGDTLIAPEVVVTIKETAMKYLEEPSHELSGNTAI